jgi:hypothetical protein
MLRDNLAELIEPMIHRAGVHALVGRPKPGLTGGCSRSTQLSIVALKRSWRYIFCWKTGRQAEEAKWSGFELTTAPHDSRAVSTAQPKSHRTIDSQCLENPRPEGAESTLTENAAFPFQAEPRQFGALLCNGMARDILRHAKLRLASGLFYFSLPLSQAS